jgi:hypothetical protein
MKMTHRVFGKIDLLLSPFLVPLSHSLDSSVTSEVREIEIQHIRKWIQEVAERNL